MSLMHQDLMSLLLNILCLHFSLTLTV